jgi:enoyl-CoA hydratase/carnithine racemase
VNGFAQAQARKLADKPSASLRITKQLMKKGNDASLKAIMDDELVQFGQLLRGPAAKEAISAFMERRKPDFSKF